MQVIYDHVAFCFLQRDLIRHYITCHAGEKCVSAQTERCGEIECGRVPFFFVFASRVPGAARALFGLNHLSLGF